MCGRITFALMDELIESCVMRNASALFSGDTACVASWCHEPWVSLSIVAYSC